MRKLRNLSPLTREQQRNRRINQGRVYLVSPFKNSDEIEQETNDDYLRACMRESMDRGEKPFAPHGMYPYCLDDNDSRERQLGMELGHAWLSLADYVVVYTDRGVSSGMRWDIELASSQGIPIKMRSLGPDWMSKDWRLFPHEVEAPPSEGLPPNIANPQIDLFSGAPSEDMEDK